MVERWPSSYSCMRIELFMAALRSRCGHYTFLLWFNSIFLLRSSSFFFSRLFSAVADCMSAILPHMVWPSCEYRMQVWNVLHTARWNTGRKKVAKNSHLHTIAQLCQAISSQLRHVLTIGKTLFKQQYGELWPTNGWNRVGSLGHPS